MHTLGLARGVQQYSEQRAELYQYTLPTLPVLFNFGNWKACNGATVKCLWQKRLDV